MVVAAHVECMSTHRLLPSIVFASTSLLAGCGGEIDSQTSFPEPPVPDGSPGAVELKPGQLPAKEPDAGANEADARACEGGWPTTKGQICTFDAGLACCTASFQDPDAGVVCCPTGQGQ